MNGEKLFIILPGEKPEKIRGNNIIIPRKMYPVKDLMKSVVITKIITKINLMRGSSEFIKESDSL